VIYISVSVLTKDVGSTLSNFRDVDRNRYVHACKNERERERERKKKLHHAHALQHESTSFSRKEDPSFASDAGSFIRESRGRARARLLIREPHEKGNLPDGRVVLGLDAEENHIHDTMERGSQ